MLDALRLKFQPDSDGTGELFAEVLSKGFAGSSSAWFDDTELIELARKLAATFPLQAQSPLGIHGGFWNKSGGSIEQEHIGLIFYPVGSVGQVGCRITLSSPVYEHDRRESQSSLAVELTTTYERLGTFARSLEMLVTGRVDEAVLEAAS